MKEFISIKDKMLLGFFGVIFILVWFSSILIYRNHFMAKEYNDLMGDVVILNAISEDIDKSMKSIDKLLLTRSTPHIDEFYSYLYDSRIKIDEFELMGVSKQNYYRIKDLKELLIQFEKYCEATYTIALASNKDVYIRNHEDARRVHSHIQNLTLEMNDSIAEEGFGRYENMVKQNQRMTSIFITILITILLGVLIYVYLFSNNMIRGISKLTLASKIVSTGRFDIPEIEVNSNDEVEILSGAFNKMIKNTKELMNEITRKAELEKEAQLKALQSQINPHFLFNTLNVIDKMALIEGADTTCELIESLSDLLRYNLRKSNSTVTIKDELYILRQYVYIQKTRFSDRVEYIESVDEKLEKYVLPALTFQPIIENAFIHGIEGMEEAGKVGLEIYDDEEMIVIKIWDNGKGIDFEKKDKKGHTTGIGLGNVRERLKIFFKGKSNLKLYNSEEGAVVEVKIPKVGEANV